MLQHNCQTTMIKLQTKGLTVAISHQCGTHNQFSNHYGIIQEHNTLLAPTVLCQDIDIEVTKPVWTPCSISFGSKRGLHQRLQILQTSGFI